MVQLESVVSWYGAVVAHPSFGRRQLSSPLVAESEAAVYKFLTDAGLHPKLHEHASHGGADFECGDEYKFSIEVTAISAEVLARRVGDASENPEAAARAAASIVRSRLSKKGTHYQATAYEGPRVLAIVCRCDGVKDTLFAMVDELLGGEYEQFVEVDDADNPVGEPFKLTKFQNAAHARHMYGGDGELEVFRPRHALTLFFMLRDDGADVFGIENPEPDHELPVNALWNVPRARLEWPVENFVTVDWVAGPRHGHHERLPGATCLSYAFKPF